MQLRYRHTVLALCLAAYFAIRFAQLVISPVVTAIMEEFSVTSGAIGLALTGMWVAYALAQLPSGVLGDRFGERRVVLLALGLAAAGSLAAGAAPAFAAFVAFVVVLGAGAGLYYNVATALLTRLFDQLGRAVGTHRIGSQVAGLDAPVAAALALAAGWRAALWVGAAVAGLVLAAFAVAVRPTPPVNPGTAMRDAVDLRTLGALLRRRPIAFAAGVAILGEFVLLATMSFLPTFLMEHHALSVGGASLLFSGYFAVVAAGQPASGWLSDRLGRDAVLAMAMLAGVAGYALLVVGTTFASAVPAVALVGFAMSWGAPLQSRVMDDLGAAERGVGFGLVRTLYILGGATGNAAVGAVADVAGWGPAFGVLAVLLAVAFAAIVGNRLLRLGA